ncbi:MAG: asparagine--tRNA ligase [Cytophagales bacterium]|jgi:asparaginyl-tRNA synthetase|nr:asparagine--tRNA ligase [Cytophagales bacterium]MCA6387423.1 asparagine--tRNA ligase [Cytophagales bacterium]MCA6390208.1 asparagine--tRNA ligase [Cytophagales bacterium]MCA6396815.1 asparagine--tRNA ligase [Cytophagales bacterium]MCA6397267.1 asparagine--tRNA ligase [Cytophagales bacterium]
MKRVKIKELLATPPTGQVVKIQGWVRTFRNNQFIALNDGSTIQNMQAVVALASIDDAMLKRITTGACLSIQGELIASLGKGQSVEVKVTELEILGDCDAEKFPLQPKKHSLEFLREIAHLRSRTNTISAVMRVRHAMAFAIHRFFNERGFYYIHTPIITGSDAEGAGDMFRVTTLDGKNPPLDENGHVNHKEDFFGRETNLTVSGQLEGETYALALSEIYTFGPTFRAENSNTARHLAEFWMIEPEMAFYDIHDNMQLATDLLQYLVRYALDNCSDDLEFLNKRAQEEEATKPQEQRSELSLLERLKFVVENDFQKLSYTEAIEILKNSTPNKKKKFQYVVEEWGVDLQSEHERYLVEKHFKKPVILYNYPKNIKAFYMRQNEDDKTVAAMDVLFPGIGEIIGGSQREERHDRLLKRIQEMNLPEKELWWYLELRKFGSAPHSGFGLGFERLILFVTGMTNIRDVIPFPRFPKSAEF